MYAFLFNRFWDLSLTNCGTEYATFKTIYDRRTVPVSYDRRTVPVSYSPHFSIRAASSPVSSSFSMIESMWAASLSFAFLVAMP